MEELQSLIFYGCKLARDLELNLPHLINQPDKVMSSCNEIIGIFTSVRDMLNRSSPYELPFMAEMSGDGLPEWMRFSVTQAMDTLLQNQMFQGLPENKVEVSNESGGTGDGEGSGQFGSGGFVATDVGNIGRGAMQRQRRRKDNIDKRSIRVPAPRMGNTEIPPDDGHTWRKYGQKEILGSKYPRSYYRCTHQKLYNCPAKKQVQRLDHDPFTFEVTYREDHTCHMSLAAPSIPTISNEILQTPPSPSASLHPFTRWLSMNLNPSGIDTSTRYEGFISDDMGAGTSGGGVDDSPHVDDLADAMFNNGSGGNNSMDKIFSSNVEEKWESEEKTK